MRTDKLKSAYNLLITGPRGLQCETNLLEIMGLESSVFRFDLGPLIQGESRQPNLKVLIVYRKSWAGNLLMWSDVTLGLSFQT